MFTSPLPEMVSWRESRLISLASAIWGASAPNRAVKNGPSYSTTWNCGLTGPALRVCLHLVVLKGCIATPKYCPGYIQGTHFGSFLLSCDVGSRTYAESCGMFAENGNSVPDKDICKLWACIHIFNSTFNTLNDCMWALQGSFSTISFSKSVSAKYFILSAKFCLGGRQRTTKAG